SLEVHSQERLAHVLKQGSALAVVRVFVFFRPGIDHVESAGGIEIIGKAYAYIFEELTGTGTARVVSSAPASQPALGTTQVLIGVLPIGVPGMAEESQANNHGFEAALEKLGDENKVAKRLAHLVPLIRH